MLPDKMKIFGLSILSSILLASTSVAQTQEVPPPMGATNLCVDLPWACEQRAGSEPSMALLAAINKRANGTRPMSDQAQYGVPEHWALPTQRGGDCEDIALLKMKLLLEAGVDSSLLTIATVLNGTEGHAVLLVRVGGQNYILDNLTNRITTKSSYRFLRSQNPKDKRKWISHI